MCMIMYWHLISEEWKFAKYHRISKSEEVLMDLEDINSCRPRIQNSEMHSFFTATEHASVGSALPHTTP